VQAGSAADIEKGFSGEPILAEQTNKTALGFDDARVVDDAGIARPVLPEGEMAGDVLERRPMRPTIAFSGEVDFRFAVENASTQ